MCVGPAPPPGLAATLPRRGGAGPGGAGEGKLTARVATAGRAAAIPPRAAGNAGRTRAVAILSWGLFFFFFSSLLE